MADTAHLKIAAWWCCEVCEKDNFVKLFHDEQKESSKNDGASYVDLPKTVKCSCCATVFSVTDGEFNRTEDAE